MTKEIKNEKETKKIICETDLENVSGGYVFNENSLGLEKLPFPARVIDDFTGEELAGYRTMEEAKKMAKKMHQSSQELKSQEDIWELQKRSEEKSFWKTRTGKSYKM